jgi:hypothetical protein
MAQVGWFMYQRWDDLPVGIFGSEDAAKQAATDGEYVIVPIEANQVYINMMDETLPGAIIYTATGFDTRIDALENQMANAQTAFQNLRDEFDTFKAQAQTAVQNLNQAVADLDARVTALEGA